MPVVRRRRPGPSGARTAVLPAALLVVSAPPADAGRSVALRPAGTTLGRDPACDLALSSEHVSRNHALVYAHGGDYLIEDLGSRNGTSVNGTAVTDPVPLRDGDALALADVRVEFRLTSPPLPPPPPAEPSEEDRRRVLEEPTRPLGTPSLRQELKEAPGFSTPALLLAVGGSVVGAALTSAMGTGAWGSLAGAAVAPVVSTAFSTRRAGEKGRVRVAAIVVLSAIALAVTWSSVSLAERATGSAVLPGAGERTRTFPGLTKKETSTPPVGGVALRATTTVECGAAALDSTVQCEEPVVVTSTGSARLRLTSVELAGAHPEDFRAGDECVGAWLDTGESCAITVRFAPSDTGERAATLVVHQNLPHPDDGTEISLRGTGGDGEQPDPNPDPDRCVEGFVWREAVPGDRVCVTPATRDETARDNGLAESRRDPDGGPYGEDTCLDGYVWREAVDGDRVCVTSATRARAQQDNALADIRRAG